jgi:hypothetical protein
LVKGGERLKNKEYFLNELFRLIEEYKNITNDFLDDRNQPMIYLEPIRIIDKEFGRLQKECRVTQALKKINRRKK